MISLIIILVYLALLFGACAWAKKREAEKAARGEKTGFLMGGKNLPFYLIFFMMAGNVIGGSSTTGTAQLAMTGGFSGVWYGWAGVFGVMVLALLGAKRLRILGYNTTSEMLNDYCGRVPRFLLCLGQLFIILGVRALQYYAGGAFLASMFPGIISMQMGMLITAAAFLLICFFGGLLGASLANMINVIVIFFSLILCTVVAVANHGGWSAVHTAVANIPEATQHGGSWWSLTGGVGIAYALSLMVSEPGNRISTQSNTMLALTAKSPKVAKWGILCGGLTLLPVTAICAVLGLICRAFYPETPSAQAMSTVLMTLHPVLSGIGLAGLWAVIVSSGVALLLASVQLVEFDILAPLRKEKSARTEKQEKATSRIILVILTAVTVLAAFTIKSFVSAFLAILCITPAFFVLVVAVLYCPKLIKKSSAIVTMGCAYVFFLLWMFVPAVKAAFPTAIYFEWPMCIAVFILCCIFDKRKISIPERRAESFERFRREEG